VARTVAVYTQPEQCSVWQEDQTLAGEPVLPGFTPDAGWTGSLGLKSAFEIPILWELYIHASPLSIAEHGNPAARTASQEEDFPWYVTADARCAVPLPSSQTITTSRPPAGSQLPTCVPRP